MNENDVDAARARSYVLRDRYAEENTNALTRIAAARDRLTDNSPAQICECDADWHCEHGGCEGCDECDALEIDAVGTGHYNRFTCPECYGSRFVNDAQYPNETPTTPCPKCS